MCLHTELRARRASNSTKQWLSTAPRNFGVTAEAFRRTNSPSNQSSDPLFAVEALSSPSYCPSVFRGSFLSLASCFLLMLERETEREGEGERERERGGSFRVSDSMAQRKQQLSALTARVSGRSASPTQPPTTPHRQKRAAIRQHYSWAECKITPCNAPKPRPPELYLMQLISDKLVPILIKMTKISVV